MVVATVLVLVDDKLEEGGIALELARRVWRGLALRHNLCRLSEASSPPPSGTQVVLYGMELEDSTAPLWARSFLGCVYAVDVGVGPTLSAEGLRVYEHVYVRSLADLALAQGLGAGPSLATLLPNLPLAVLAPPTSSQVMRKAYLRQALSSGRPLLGLCVSPDCGTLAQISALAAGLVQRFEVCLLALSPADAELNQQLAANDWRLHLLRAQALRDPNVMSSLCGEMDMLVTTHLHAALFALRAGKPCATLEGSGSVAKVYGLPSFTLEEAARLEVPFTLADGPARPPPPSPQLLGALKAALLLARRRPRPIALQVNAEPQDELARMLAAYLELQASTAMHWLLTPASTAAKRLLLGPEKQPGEVARLFVFAVVRQVGALWLEELQQHIFAEGTAPAAALPWLIDKYSAALASAPPASQTEEDSQAATVPRTVVWDVSYFDQHESQGMHRHGWAWVMEGLHMFDGKATGRTPTLRLDACLDRTMLWGYETLKAAGIIPYTVPWAGFVHHPLSSEGGLFERPLMLASLPYCRCLFVMSTHLAKQVRRALVEVGHGAVAVHVVSHPMPAVPAAKMFDLHNFMRNPHRKVVQVGAWLRNTWSIFQLALSAQGDFAVAKAALVGPFMEGYYKPPGLMEQLRHLLLEGPAQGVGQALCRAGTTNAFSKGMFSMLEGMDRSVAMLPQLSNDEYDNMLGGPSGAVVFLHLTDASAVNTVLECMVRATPLIVNRHPALEEVLGAGYPAFYEDLVQAAQMATSLTTLHAAHHYLRQLPKDHLKLETFLGAVQKALLA